MTNKNRFAHRCLPTLLLVMAVALARPAWAGSPSVAVMDTEFRISRADGTVIAQADLPGTVLTMADGNSGKMTIRIDGVVQDAKASAGGITLYALSRLEPATGDWKPFCKTAPDGTRLAFPLSGVWTDDGRHLPSDRRFEITCTSGAIGKCVRAGYHPWRTASDGTPLRDLHQACVRMLRADYCGNGHAATRDGTSIDMHDRLGIQRTDAGADFSFEAAWGPNGAICVARSRIPELASLTSLLTACPEKLQGRLGAVCSEESASRDGALLFNKSRSP